MAGWSEQSVVQAFKTELAAVVLVGTATIVFGDNVHTPAVFTPADGLRIAQGGFPCAMALFAGSTSDEENEQFVKTNVSVIIMVRNPADASGQQATIADDGILAIVKAVRKRMKYFSDSHDDVEVYWVHTSAGAAVKRPEDAGGFVAIEMKFEVKHMSTDE